MSVGLVLVAADLGQFRIRSNPGRHCNLAHLFHLRPQLADCLVRLHVVFFTILCDVQVCLVQTCSLKAWIVYLKHTPDLFRFGSILVKVEWHVYQARTQLVSDEAGHATATSELPGMVVACCEDAFADSKWDILELWPVKLFHSGVECIAVDMYQHLAQIATKLQFSNILVRPFQILLQASLRLDALELALFGQDPVDFEREGLVLVLLVVEVSAALGSVVDYL